MIREDCGDMEQSTVSSVQQLPERCGRRGHGEVPELLPSVYIPSPSLTLSSSAARIQSMRCLMSISTCGTGEHLISLQLGSSSTWVTFSVRLYKELHTRSNNTLVAVFKPQMERLMGSLCRYCQIEPDTIGWWCVHAQSYVVDMSCRSHLPLHWHHRWWISSSWTGCMSFPVFYSIIRYKNAALILKDYILEFIS